MPAVGPGHDRAHLAGRLGRPALRLSHGGPGTQGVAPAGSTTDDDPDESAELVALGAHSDVDGNGSDDLADACRDVPGSGLPDVDHNGYVDACDPTLASLHAYPAAPPPTTGTSNDDAVLVDHDAAALVLVDHDHDHALAAAARARPAPTRAGASTDAGASSTDTTTTPPPGLTRPTLTKLGARPSTARRATRTHRRATAAVVRYTLSGPATVTLTLQRVVDGHRKGRTCSTRVRRGKRCRALVTVKGAQRLAGIAGANELRFAGTLGNRKLAPGAYVLTLVAVSPGGASAPATVTLTVR